MTDLIQQMPKVQLHDHLDGGLRPETILELADAQGVTLPETDPVALGDWFFRGAAQGDLPKYLEGFAITTAVMQDEESLRRIAKEHVEDLAKAHVMALDYMAGGGESRVLNCGYGRGFTVREVIDVVKSESGVDFPVQQTGRRAGDPGALMADNSRIREVLGWQPDHDDLTVIVKTALAWEKIWQQKRASA